MQVVSFGAAALLFAAVLGCSEDPLAKESQAPGAGAELATVSLIQVSVDGVATIGARYFVNRTQRTAWVHYPVDPIQPGDPYGCETGRLYPVDPVHPTDCRILETAGSISGRGFLAFDTFTIDLSTVQGTVFGANGFAVQVRDTQGVSRTVSATFLSEG